MRTIRYIFVASLFLITWVNRAEAQKRFPTTDGVTLSQFEGNFYLLFDKNQARNFYAVNMNTFTDEAAAKHFQQAVFKDSKLVSVSVPEKGIWYLSASTVEPESDINDKLTLLKDQALGFAATLTTESRKIYLSDKNK